MRLIHDNTGRIVGEATDNYAGPLGHVPAPAGFDFQQSGDWVVVDGEVQITEAAALRRIDADVDAITGAVIGARQAEYEEAERQARAYAAAGYTGDMPGMVQSWAVAKGWTGQQAADDILAQSDAWRGAQALIRAQRLLRKEQIRQAVGPAARAMVMQGWAAFVAAVRVQLSVGEP